MKTSAGTGACHGVGRWGYSDRIMRQMQRLTILGCFMGLLVCFAAMGQPDSPPALPEAETNAPANAPAAALASPRATVFSFLKAIRQVDEGDFDAWPTVLATIDFRHTSLEPDSQPARQAAQDLWRAMNHIRAFRPEELPGRSDLAQDVSTWTLFPRPDSVEDLALIRAVDLDDMAIALVRLPDGSWKFSSRTIEQASELYDALRPLGAKVAFDDTRDLTRPWLEQHMPPSLQGQVLDVAYWQWLGLLVLILMGVTLDHVVRAVLRVVTGRVLRQQDGEAKAATIATAMRPVGLLAAGVFWLLTVNVLQMPGIAHTVLVTAARLFTVIATVWAAWRVVDLISEVAENKAKQTRSRFDDVLVPLVRKSLKIFITAFGVIYAASTLNINIWPMLASLGIATAGIAFAAKDTIENFFGSIAVILDRPFEVGDWVVIEGKTEGTVEQVGFRSTRVRTFYNSQITVPNANLVRATVDNYGRRKYRRWSTTLGIQYDTPPATIVTFTEGIRELIRQHPYTRKDYYQVWFNGFGSSSLEVLVYVFYEAPDWSTELRERERLALDILRLADQLGVQFAFPTQTVHLYKEEHSEPTSRHEPPQSATDRRAMVKGVKAARTLIADQKWKQEKPGPVEFTDTGSVDEEDEHTQAGDGDDQKKDYIEDRRSGG